MLVGHYRGLLDIILTVPDTPLTFASVFFSIGSCFVRFTGLRLDLVGLILRETSFRFKLPFTFDPSNTEREYIEILRAYAKLPL